jgi:hypothetical protein
MNRSNPRRTVLRGSENFVTVIEGAAVTTVGVEWAAKNPEYGIAFTPRDEVRRLMDAAQAFHGVGGSKTPGPRARR